MEVLSVDDDPECTDAALYWNLLDAEGRSVILGGGNQNMGRTTGGCIDRGPLQLPASTTYELHVFAGAHQDDPATGSYALRLLDAG